MGALTPETLMRIRPTLRLASLTALGTVAGCRDYHPTSAPAGPSRTAVYTTAVSGPGVLHSLDGATNGIAWGLNDLGDIVGVSNASVSATRWGTGLAASPLSTVGLPVDGGNEARDANVAGQIAGMHGNNAALWTPIGGGAYTETDIGALLAAPPFNALQSTAYGINAGGAVVGTYTIQVGSAFHLRCFLWAPALPNGTAGTVVDLGDLAGGGGQCIANDVNSAGQVVGASTPSAIDPTLHAFTWSGTMTDLAPAGGSSYGTAINDAGQVAGQRVTPSGGESAAVWTPSGPGSWSVLDLGAPALSGQSGIITSAALDIDDAGFVVGYTQAPDLGVLRAFFWQNGTFTELPPPGPAPIAEATALTNLAGNAVVVSGLSYADSYTPLRWAVTLTPVVQQGCLEQLASLITSLRGSGALSAGEARSLRAKVDAATRQIDQAKTTPAKNLLYALINEVNALVAAGHLSAADGQALIDAARCAIAEL